MALTSSVLRGKHTASGGMGLKEDSSLPCCWRSCSAVVKRSPRSWESSGWICVFIDLSLSTRFALAPSRRFLIKRSHSLKSTFGTFFFTYPGQEIQHDGIEFL